MRSGTADGIAGPSPTSATGTPTAGDLMLGPVPVITGKRGAEHPGQTGHVLLRIPPPRVAPDVAHPIFSQFPSYCYVKD